MELKSEFTQFLTDIRPTDAQRKEMQKGHSLLRERLLADEKLSKVVESDFLQGSYRRHTAVRPKGEKRSDVDIIIVTKLHESDYPDPEKAMDEFTEFLDKPSHYKGRWRKQGRSIGISMSTVDLDLVITAAPSVSEIGILKSAAVRSDDDIVEAPDWRLDAEWQPPWDRPLGSRTVLGKTTEPEWKGAPLRIPDRSAKRWDDTNPLAQLQVTRDKNRVTGGHFVNVVKAIKWWRLESHGDSELEHPKGFTLERIVFDCCPDDVDSVADGVVRTLEAIAAKYVVGKPVLLDYGVKRDVLTRVDPGEFGRFYQHAVKGAKLARKAYDESGHDESCKLWRDLFGDKFPKGDGGGGAKKGGFEEPDARAVPGSGRFAQP